MNPPVLREAAQEDFDSIARLNLASEHFLSRMDLARLRALAAQAAYLRVVEREGRVAAFLMAFAPGSAYDSENYGWFSQRYASFLYIDRVVVDESQRGHGLATMLYEDLFGFGRANGVRHIVCEFDTDPPNRASERFHARFGFREVGSRRVSYADKRVAMQEFPLAAWRPARGTMRGMETPAERPTGKPALPDRLSVDPRSPHYIPEIFEHDVGIRLNGKERHDVEEYCVSEGWVRVPAGKTLDRHGRPLLIKIKGQVEAFYR